MLTGKQRRHLRALGHHLTPIVQVGKEGITEALLAALAQAIAQHELVKVRLGEAAGDDRQGLAKALSEGTRAELAGILGRTVLLYRRHPKEPKIVLPKKA
jgi:RNA-binding protein